MARLRVASFALVLLSLVSGCPSSPTGGGDDAGENDAGGSTTLDGTIPDGGVSRDAASPSSDAPLPDAVGPEDAAALDDASVPDDAFVALDAGSDAGCPDCSGLDDACHVGVCAGTTCMVAPRRDGTLCDDGDACTTSDACVGGACTGTPSYAWSTGPFGLCSASCGAGEQSRGVQCTRCGTTVVDAALCVDPAPPATQSCDAGACPTYTWLTAPFSSCSASCGGGTQRRVVSCIDDTGTLVFEGLCPSPRPTEVQTCNTGACDTYAWVTGRFSTCSASCGGGTQTRSVTCASASGGAVADTLCSGVRPDTTQTCNATPCTGFGWVPTAWSTCSVACGTGTRTRTVVCTNSSGAAVASSNCTGLPMPPTSEACGGNCYHWSASAWSTCSATCGTGQQSRAVTCLNEATPAPASACAGLPMPPSTQACSAPACVTYAWHAGDWSSCSAACGGGTRTRAVQCVDSMGGVAASGLCAGASPPTSESCNDQPCL